MYIDVTLWYLWLTCLLLLSKCVRIGYEGRTQCRRQSVSDLYDYVDDVSFLLFLLLNDTLAYFVQIEYYHYILTQDRGYVISQIPSQIICTRGKFHFQNSVLYRTEFPIWRTNHAIFFLVRLSIWCPSWELFWVIVTFATAAVKTPQHLYACRFLVSLMNPPSSNELWSENTDFFGGEQRSGLLRGPFILLCILF